jgi:transposase-like protein
MTCCSAAASQQLFAEAARTNVSAACRTFGVHRSTYYHWQRQVDRHGLENAAPQGASSAADAERVPEMIEERIVSFSIAHQGYRTQACRLGAGAGEVGVIVVSPDGVEGSLSS